MDGKRFELWVKAVNGEWHRHTMFAQSVSWLEADKVFFERLGLETRVDEFNCEYDNR